MEKQETKIKWVYPNPKTTDPEEHQWQRIFEIIPGALTWTTLIGMVLLSWLCPLVAAITIIIYDVYWLYRAIYISSYSLMGRIKMGQWKKIDWLYRLKRIYAGEELIKELKTEIVALEKKLKKNGFQGKTRRALKWSLKERKDFLKRAKQDLVNRDQFLDWNQVYNVILLPTAVEGAEHIAPAIESIKNSNYPNKKVIILLATEEREDKEKREKKVRILKEKFDGVFYDFIVTTHKVATGEMKCKASNATYAAKKLKKYLEKKKIPLENVILSNFDCDTIMHPEYLPALTYAFATEPNRHNRAYQPVPVFDNNIWDAIAPVRILMLGTSFWHMVKVMQPETMVTFSSHSESFKTIVDMDYWPVNVISEDSLIYWKAFAYFEGNYQVKPIYLPVSMTAVIGNNYLHALRNQYKQKHRWAYGIENFPLFARAFMKTERIPLFEKIKRSLIYTEGHYSWAVTPFILAFLGWLPLILGGEEFNQSVLAHNLPYITRTLMTLALVGLATSMTMSFFLLPPRPKKYTCWKYLPMLFQWIMAPFIFLIAAIPAVHAQSRIMLGKYMGEFWVTEKIEKK